MSDAAQLVLFPTLVEGQPASVCYVGSSRLWDFGGAAAVVAENVGDACRVARAAGYGVVETEAREMPADELLTVYWHDAGPPGFACDFCIPCQCDVGFLDRGGCTCEARTPSLTLSAAQWVQNPQARRGMRVIGDFQD